MRFSLFMVVLACVLILGSAIAGQAQTWGIYTTLDGHASITRATEAGFWRWTYIFWHGNQTPDPVYEVSVRFLTLDDGAVDATKGAGEHYWDYKGVWETGAGPGATPTDYTWNGENTPISGITEVPSGGVSAGLWSIGSANQSEFRRFTVSFLTDLPGVGRNYLDISGDTGISHSMFGEVPVPEPGTLVTISVGLTCILGGLRRRRS